MQFFSLFGVEWEKLRRSKIFLLLFLPLVVLWIPNVLNADMNFQKTAVEISPENNFFIQSFMGMSWFMFPASIVVCTVLLIQTERANRGILKMMSLPINTVKCCLSKFAVLVILAAVQMSMMVGMYFLCAQIAGQMQNYSLTLSPGFVIREAGLFLAASLPMISFYWMAAVCIQTPIFAVGIRLVSIVPSVLMINTKVWFLYPMCYPFYLITSEYSKMSSGLTEIQMDLVPWILTATAMTLCFLMAACMRFGKAERR